jgi:hypothetical protein
LVNWPAGTARPSEAACLAHIGEKAPEPLRLGLGAQRRERASGERKFGRHVGHRSDLAHHPVDDAARGAAGHEIGQRGAVVARRVERGAMRRRNLASEHHR